MYIFHNLDTSYLGSLGNSWLVSVRNWVDIFGVTHVQYLFEASLGSSGK